MSSEEPLVYLNDGFVSAGAAQLPVYDAAIVMGATVTDFVRTFHQRLFRLQDHLTRFCRGCDAVGIALPLSKAELEAVCWQLVRHNAPLADGGAELALIMFASPGGLATYAGHPLSAAGAATLCVHTFPLPLQMWRQAMRQGAHVVTPATRHLPPQCLDPAIKCRSRMHWWMAEREAHAADPRAMALCLDLEGRITETSRANFALVRDGCIFTPCRENVLWGVSLTVLTEICRDLKISLSERDLWVEDVLAADEAMLVGTTCCLAPVTMINH
ncbi:MAG: aminotransferase class IV, partial [Kiritimatiellia bacterium]